MEVWGAWRGKLKAKLEVSVMGLYYIVKYGFCILPRCIRIIILPIRYIVSIVFFKQAADVIGIVVSQKRCRLIQVNRLLFHQIFDLYPIPLSLAVGEHPIICL